MFRSHWRWAAGVMATALVYYGAARLGLLLQLPGTNASPFWPPSGIGLAAVLLLGLRVWPGILLGAFAANLLTLPATPAGFLASAAIGVGNTLEHVVALLLLRRLVPSLSPFDRARDVFWFVVTGGLSCAVASLNGATSLWLTGIIPAAAYGQVCVTWWLGDTAGMLVLAPALCCWWRTPRLGLSAARTLELVLLVTLTALGAEFLFGGWLVSEVVASLPYLVVPALLWAAFRFGPRETATLAVLLSGIAVAHTWLWMGRPGPALQPRTVLGPFVSPAITPNESLLLLQLFVSAVAVTALTLAAAVAERTQVERALTEAEARYRTIFEQAAVGVALIETATGRFVRVNRRYCDLVGYTADEMSHTTFQAITHPEDLSRDLENMRRLVAGEIGEFTMEKRYLHRAGSILWVNLTVSPTWRPGQKPEYHIAIVEDITERKRAEEQFRLAVEAAPNGMVVVDQEGRITLVNAQMETLFGYGREELLDQPIEILVPQRFRVHHPAHRIAFLANPQARAMGAGRDLYGVRKDGSEFPVEIGLNPMQTEAGTFVLASIIDITERQRAERQSRDLNAELEQRVRDRTAELEAANKELEAFSYSVSHDLRAPLRAIDGFSRILLEKHWAALPDEGQDYLQRVRDNTQQMGRLIDDLLTFARLSRLPIKKQRVEPAQIVRRCLAELGGEQEGPGLPAFRARRLEITVADLPACSAEPSLLKQVWVNLLSNALKYTRTRDVARIEVGCCLSEPSGEPIYFVKDNGVGFDMRYAHKLFGVFQRLHRAEDYEGTGVGLAIVQRIVHRHGGRVWAEARPGQGATFSFTLQKEEPHAG
jgi:PAS domain S-box-containing protein